MTSHRHYKETVNSQYHTNSIHSQQQKLVKGHFGYKLNYYSISD